MKEKVEAIFKLMEVMGVTIEDLQAFNQSIEAAKKLAEQLNISATPAFYINGKAISGYNESLILKALNNIK